MSPEQARGKAVDKRSDIWAFGCVFYEMLTARPAFARDDDTETLAAIVRDEPAWDALPPDTPPRVLTLLRRCLVKDPQQRLRDLGDARLVMEGAFDTSARTQADALVSPATRPWTRLATYAAVLLLGSSLAGLAVWSRMHSRVAAAGAFRDCSSVPTRASRSAGRHLVTMSPDNRFIALCGERGAVPASSRPAASQPHRGHRR